MRKRRLRQLSEAERNLIVEDYSNGYSVQEIADAYNVTVNQLNPYLQRAGAVRLMATDEAFQGKRPEWIDEQYARILSDLAAGIHPITMERLPEGLLDQEMVCRALKLGAAALRDQEPVKPQQKNGRGRKKESASRSNDFWTLTDEEKLLYAYEKGMDLAVVARYLGRTQSATEKKLMELLEEQWQETITEFLLLDVDAGDEERERSGEPERWQENDAAVERLTAVLKAYPFVANELIGCLHSLKLYPPEMKRAALNQAFDRIAACRRQGMDDDSV